ncbi:MAG TPA: SRPBCC family protein [Ferruginibacter sp.]|nr:SRPBCC family protein [Ferruginibacter sp.]
METQQRTVLTVENTINAPVEKVWNLWSNPGHITKWCSPSDDWHTPSAENDLRTGGKFMSRMEARDGSMGFDFGGVYDEVRNNEYIEYTISDGRKVKINFTPQGNSTKVVESFEAEDMNPIEMQQGGWQAIMDSFKKYAEANS